MIALPGHSNSGKSTRSLRRMFREFRCHANATPAFVPISKI
jgi:hypothetical protein